MRGGYMELNLASTCDVLVLGSGIAGISAALTAAESGASVILVCKGRLFSGSSFYPGTWGLGLVGPADEADEADLISTIEETIKIQQEGRTARQSAETELAGIEEKLKQTLLAAREGRSAGK